MNKIIVNTKDQTYTINYAPPTLLWALLRKHGFFTGHSCSGVGMCQKCLVKIEKGDVSPPSPLELQKLNNLPHHYRLACQTWLYGNATIELLEP